jgi:hypothetical protein
MAALSMNPSQQNPMVLQQMQQQMNQMMAMMSAMMHPQQPQQTHQPQQPQHILGFTGFADVSPGVTAPQEPPKQDPLGQLFSNMASQKP